jgi:adenylylsulfate kinase
LETGWCVWITGLPGSGKSTITELLVKRLRALRVHVQVVSIDMIRQYATPRPTYTEEERDVVYGALVFTAKMLTENCVNVIIDATGNRRRYRSQARQAIPRFMEAHVTCPIEICMQREARRRSRHLAPAHIYRKAANGGSDTVPGVGVPYEAPRSPGVTVDSSKLSAEEAAAAVLAAIRSAFE